MDDDNPGQTFVAIYHGATIGSARLIGVTTDPEMVAQVAERILEESRTKRTNSVVAKLEAGRQRALRQIISNARD